MIKRSLSLLLTVAMLLAVISMLPASAAEASEEPAAAEAVEDPLSPYERDFKDSDIAAQGEPYTEGTENPAEPETVTEIVEETVAETTAETVAEETYPVIIGFKDENGGVKISWKPFGENQSYRVYRMTDRGWERLAEVKTTDCVVSQTADTTAVYTIRCVDKNGEFSSGFNTEGWSYYYQGTPEISFFANTANGVNIYWKNTYNGLMRVYRRVGNGSWLRLNDGTAFDEAIAYIKPSNGARYMFFTDTTAQTGVEYTYTLRVIDEAQNEFLTDFNSGKKFTRQPLTQITNVQNAEVGTRITWKPYSGASEYRVYYHNERPGQNSWDLLDEGWTRLTTTSGTSFTDTAASDGELRVYTVRALDSEGDFISDYDHVGWKNLCYNAPVIDKISSDYTTGDDGVVRGSVKLEWTVLPNVQYRVYRKTETSGWTRMTKTAEGTFTDDTVVAGTKYTYTLRLVDNDDNFLSDYTAGKSIVFTETPTIKSIENTEKGAKITWNTVPGADFYRVYYKTANGWARLISKYLPECVDTTVKNEETRIYTIRALDEDENFVSDFNRDGWTNLYYAPPVIKSLENTNNGVVLTWDRANGAEDYRVYRRTGNSSWTRLTQTSDSSYTDTNVASGTKYTYTLRMITADGNTFMSDYNSGKSITYVATPRISSIENTEKGAKITWNAVPGADFYRIYYKTADGWTRLVSKYLTEYVDTSVKDGETRTYTIRCLNEDEDFVSDFNRSGWSNTYYEAPVISSISYRGGGYTISWKARDGVAGYRLYRKGLNGSWSRLFDQTADTVYVDTTAKKDVIYSYTLRYLDEKGYPISDFRNNKYYYNGKLADGIIFENGSYGFSDGNLLTGFNRVSGKLRYFSGTGRLYRDTIVGNSYTGYYYTDEDGICCESKEMCLAAEFIVKYCKGDTMYQKMKYAFLYMANNYPYIRVYDDMPDDERDVPPFAVELFEIGRGTCYRYAAAYACIAKIAGFRSRFCYGMSGALYHGWTEVYVDGEWLICDVDAQLPSYGYDDYAPYMMRYHMWILDKYWYSELTVKDGKAVWGRKTYY